jgi:ferredoxin/flavodoxin
METRKSFITKAAVTAAVISYPVEKLASAVKEYPNMKTQAPKKALIIWYSQTGHTKRIGRLIGKAWEKKGIKVDALDYRKIDKGKMTSYDLIAIGTPVYYLDVPGNVKQWLTTIPEIKGTPVASFVTFGGKGDNQHNTACTILELLAAKGGVPVALELFGNMSTYAPTWSMGNEKRTLKFKHLPNRDTYAQARNYASEILSGVAAGKSIDVETRVEMGSMFKYFPQIGFSKLLIGSHYVDRVKCILCRSCEKSCPVSAIHPETGNVEKKKCILCMGCVNNCPAGAVVMTMMGKKIYSFNDLLKQHNISIEEPEELI